MTDTNDLKQVKGMLVGIEITIFGIAIGGGTIFFSNVLMLIFGILLVIFGVLRTAIAATGAGAR